MHQNIKDERDMWKSASMFKTEDKLFIPIKPGNLFQRQE